MTIMTAIETNDRVKAYDESKNIVLTESGSLYGYTSKYVSIYKAGRVSVFDEKGDFITDFPA